MYRLLLLAFMVLQEEVVEEAAVVTMLVEVVEAGHVVEAFKNHTDWIIERQS
jgi:hypothetical protein